jgi:hypothetical protein
MPIQDIVNVDISIQSAGLGQADFGTPIVLGLFTSPQNTAFGSDLTAELTPTTWRSVLTGLGFASSDAAWLAFASLFGQARRPSLALIARRATPVAQVVNVNVDGAGDGTYTVTINGVDFDFVASSNTATQIKDGLIAAINGGSEPVTAASVDSDTLSLTADVAGVPFTLALSAPSDDLSSSVITASVGIDTDLAAIEAERSDGYFVMETSRVLETQQVAVEAIESFGRPLFGLWQTDDTNAQGSSSNDDLGGWIQVNGYARSFAVWHDSDVEFVDTGLVGLLCSTEPGSYSWANQQVAGIEGIVPTSSTRLTSKGYLWLERYQAAQVNATRTGTPSGTRTWPDLVWGVDYLRAQIETDQLRGLLNASQNPGKIPYSDQGGAQIVGTLRSTLQRFADSGFLVADSIQAATITKAQQTSGNQAARKWAGVTFSATAQGAINTLEITGVINQ